MLTSRTQSASCMPKSALWQVPVSNACICPAKPANLKRASATCAHAPVMSGATVPYSMQQQMHTSAGHYTEYINTPKSSCGRSRHRQHCSGRSVKAEAAGPADSNPQEGDSHSSSHDFDSCSTVQQLQQLITGSISDLNHCSAASAMIKLQQIISGSPLDQQMAEDSIQLLNNLWQVLQPDLRHCGACVLADLIVSHCNLPGVVLQQFEDKIKDELIAAFLEESNLGSTYLEEDNPRPATPMHVSKVMCALARSGLQVCRQHRTQLARAFSNQAEKAYEDHRSALERYEDVYAVGYRSQISPQNLADFFWAAVELDIWPHHTYERHKEFTWDLYPMRIVCEDLVYTHEEDLKPHHVVGLFRAFSSQCLQWSKYINPLGLKDLLHFYLCNSHMHPAGEVASTVINAANLKVEVDARQLQGVLNNCVTLACNGNLTPCELANTLKALALMKHPMHVVSALSELLGVFVDNIKQASVEDVANVLWACAKFRYLPINLLTAPEFVSIILAAEPRDLVNIAWACGQLEHKDEQLMAAIMGQVEKTLIVDTTKDSKDTCEGYSAEDLSSLCWVVSALNMQKLASSVPTLAKAWNVKQESIYSWNRHTRPQEDHIQLHKAHLWMLKHQLAGGQGLLGALTEQQLELCKVYCNRAARVEQRLVPANLLDTSEKPSTDDDNPA